MDKSPGTGRHRKWGREAKLFGVTFAGCLALFGIGYFFLRQSSIYDPYLAFNARISASILNLFGSSTAVHDSTVLSPLFSFRVSPECTSTVFTAILASAVLAWPSTIKEKVVGLVTSAAVLLVINAFRIVSLFYVGSALPNFLDIAHFFLWQAVLIMITVGLWILWSERMVGKTTLSGVSRSKRTSPQRF